MRTRTIKKSIIPYIVCAGLFALAGVLQYIDNDLPLFWDKACALIANLIFFLLIFVWGYSVKSRIVQDSTRRLLIAVAALMFVWLLLRYVKYHFFMPYDTASRYLWYLYYVPQCFVPPLTLIAALGLTGKSNRAMSKYVYLLLVPAFIFVILILTNDLHQKAFEFGENFRNFESAYEHGALYYATMVWICGVMTAVVVTLFVKCSISACRQKIWIPIAVAALCTVAGTLCFLFATRSYKVPELFIFSYILIMESCVRIGLVPSNENYEKFFASSAVSSVITDENLRPVFRTAALAETDIAPYERAKAEGTVLLDDNTRLSCKRISGGNVFYAENLSAINELLGKLSVVNETLTEEGDLIAYENELKERAGRDKRIYRAHGRKLRRLRKEPARSLRVSGVHQKAEQSRNHSKSERKR